MLWRRIEDRTVVEVPDERAHPTGALHVPQALVGHIARRPGLNPQAARKRGRNDAVVTKPAVRIAGLSRAARRIRSRQVERQQPIGVGTDSVWFVDEGPDTWRVEAEEFVERENQSERIGIDHGSTAMATVLKCDANLRGGT